MKRSSVPSTPNRGPAGSSRPIRDAAADNAVLIGAGNRTHSDMPPTPGPGSQSGRCRSSSDSSNARRCTENLSPLRQELVALREKPCGGELFENGRAHVDRWAQRGDGGDGGALGADPADPQAAPERLRHRADRQHQISPRRHRRGHRFGYRFVQPHVENGFVDDGAGPGLGDDARQPLSVCAGIVSPVGFWLSGIR